jgi:hypothetical protein
MTSSVILLLFLNEKSDFCYSRVFFSSFDFGFDLDLRALSQISRSISFSVSKRCPWFDLFFPAFCSSLDSGRASFSVHSSVFDFPVQVGSFVRRFGLRAKGD